MWLLQLHFCDVLFLLMVKYIEEVIQWLLRIWRFVFCVVGVGVHSYIHLDIHRFVCLNIIPNVSMHKLNLILIYYLLLFIFIDETIHQYDYYLMAFRNIYLFSLCLLHGGGRHTSTFCSIRSTSIHYVMWICSVSYMFIKKLVDSFVKNNVSNKKCINRKRLHN